MALGGRVFGVPVCYCEGSQSFGRRHGTQHEGGLEDKMGKERQRSGKRKTAEWIETSGYYRCERKRSSDWG